ncbi:Serine/threonine-protein kinase tousled-like 2 [Thelohanellus kitauei]|uniref:Serine/threonine-protein kinase tousled-like 2 n=1 Tax=Thelohanellus kitauei TaxID=669202 RepID=A0A0C2I9C7_THEKT|nr:Serine/threonine-protein kinase tousled-like 2 [Thelohanellus kitauei]
MVRKGTQFVEIWQDGQAFKDIDEYLNNDSREIAENNRLKDELEKIRKAINKRKPNDKNCLGIRSPTDRVRRTRGVLEESTAHNSMMPINQSCSVEDYQRYEELYKIRLNTLKKEEIELNIEREKLEKERDLHIKNMKIFANEESSRFNHNPKLNNNRYLILDMLGRGGFSEVFKAFDLNEFKFVACKIHQLNFQWTEAKKHNFVRHAVREYKIHSTLDHPNIVKFLDVFEIDNDSFGTVMEYCDGNDLDTYLKQNKIIPERDARFIIVQVAQALRYMNELRPSIIHFDLKPGNILLLSGINAWHVKIADFGLSKTLPVEGDETSIDLTTPGAGTYWYLPPECFFTGINPTKISSKVDVWSVGIIFYQCLYGRKPFGNDLSQTNILEQNTILNATSITFPMKPIVSTEAKDFIRCCLVYNKENRMDVIQMSEMPYLKYRKPERSTLPPPLTNLKISDY